MVTIEDVVAAVQASNGKLQVSDLGGEDVLWAATQNLASSPVLPEVSRAICDAWEGLVHRDRATALFVLAAERMNSVLTLGSTLDVLLTCPSALLELAEPLSRALLDRAANRIDAKDAAIAAQALDGATRLAIGNWASRYGLFDVLTRVSTTEADLFATPIARLLGICYEQWRDAALTQALERLLHIRGAEADAAFELGMTSLLDALDGGSEAEVMDGLRTARTWLARAEAAEEERTDASAFGIVLDVLLGYAGGQPASELHAGVQRLRRLLAERHMWLFGLRETWLAPRYQAEAEWLQLVALLAQTAAAVERKSWLEPRATLAQTVEAYAASRSVRLFARANQTNHGLDMVIEPRIEAAFLREEGLRAHLADWLAEATQDPAVRVAAERLLAKLEAGGESKKKRCSRAMATASEPGVRG